MKKLILVLALLCCSPALAQECGDVNENGEVTAADALGVLQSAVGLGALSCRTGDFVALEDRVALIEEGPRILGFATFGGGPPAPTTGRIVWAGLVGIRAAGKWCQASFPAEPRAHMCTEEEMRVAHAIGNYDASTEDAAGRVVSNNESYHAYFSGDDRFNGDLWNCVAYTVDVDGSAASPIAYGFESPQGRLARISSLVGPTDGLPYSWIELGYAECSDAHPIFCCR
jgi:hypothetical protein